MVYILTALTGFAFGSWLAWVSKESFVYSALVGSTSAIFFLGPTYLLTKLLANS